MNLIKVSKWFNIIKVSYFEVLELGSRFFKGIWESYLKVKFFNLTKIYFKGVKLQNLINLSVFPIVIYVLYISLGDYYNDSILGKYLVQFNINDTILNCIFASIAVYASFFYINKVRQGLLPTFNSFLGVLMVALTYFYISRIDSKYEFYSYLNSNFYYFDILLFWISSWFLDFRSFKLPLKIQNSKSIVQDTIETDNSSKYSQKDDYYREQYAKEIVELIENSSNLQSSISIGVFSEWGTGKTDFINRLRNRLVENEDNILFDFNPWLSDSSNSFSEEYFSSLSKILKPYNNSITKRIKSYTSKILGQAKQVEFKLLESIVLFFFKEKTVIEERDEINQTLKNSGKRVIVFIDDSDRITGKELLQLFKLIRNSASFSNTFFITTLDYDFTVEVLKSTKEITNEEEYLKKIFNLFLRLPVIIKESLATEILTLFLKDFNQEEGKLKYCLNKLGYKFSNFNKIIKYEGLIEKMLKNSRDVKLFYNSFKLHYRLLGNQVEIIDLFILELLKVNNFALYNRLSKEEFISCHFDKDYWSLTFAVEKPQTNNDTEKKVTISELDRYLISQNIPQGFYDDLFRKLLGKANKNLGKFADPINFNFYFSHTTPSNLVPRDQFYATLKENDEKFLDKIGEWKEAKFLDLNSIFIKFNFFSNKDYLRKFIKFYLKFGDDLKLNSDQLLLFFDEFPKNRNSYQIEIENKKDFIFEILDCQYIQFNRRIELGYIFLKQHLNKDNGSGHSILGLKSHWISKMTEIYKEGLIGEVYLNSNVFLSSLYKIIDVIDKRSDKITLNEEACLIYKSLLIKNDLQFQYYIQFFFRSVGADFQGKIAFVHEPFLHKIFPNIEDFKSRLENVDFLENDCLRLKVIILNLDFYNQSTNEVRFLTLEDYEFVNSYNKKMYEKNSETSLDEDELYEILSNSGKVQ